MTIYDDDDTLPDFVKGYVDSMRAAYGPRGFDCKVSDDAMIASLSDCLSFLIGARDLMPDQPDCYTDGCVFWRVRNGGVTSYRWSEILTSVAREFPPCHVFIADREIHVQRAAQESAKRVDK